MSWTSHLSLWFLIRIIVSSFAFFLWYVFKISHHFHFTIYKIIWKIWLHQTLYVQFYLLIINEELISLFKFIGLILYHLLNWIVEYQHFYRISLQNLLVCFSILFNFEEEILHFAICCNLIHFFIVNKLLIQLKHIVLDLSFDFLHLGYKDLNFFFIKSFVELNTARNQDFGYLI